MMHRPARAVCLLALSLIAAASSVVSSAAQPSPTLHDPQTGLTVRPPAGFVARLEPAPPAAYKSAAVRIEKADAPAFGCTVVTQILPSSEEVALGRLIASTRESSEDWRTRAWQIANETIAVEVREPFTRGTTEGLLLEGMARNPDAGQPPFRVRQTVFQTAAGSTVLTCSAERETFSKSRSLFDAIAQGVEPPR
jgi:hypothetical protein